MGSAFLTFLGIIAVVSFDLFRFSGAAVDLQRLPVLSSFNDGYTKLWGKNNVKILNNGKNVHLTFDKSSGSGFISTDAYKSGLFSASIKLPAGYTAGIVATFYLANANKYPMRHDELDFEFLGNVEGRPWGIQTNVFGNGTSGREERYNLWFDPSDGFHQYSIHLTPDAITFYIDGTPVRHTTKALMGSKGFPSKPMSMYATIWDGSDWPTNGGQSKINFDYAPFVVEFTDFVIHGCAVNSTNAAAMTACNAVADLSRSGATLPAEQLEAMRRFRSTYITYSYCIDHARYPNSSPECDVGQPDANMFNEHGQRAL